MAIGRPQWVLTSSRSGVAFSTIKKIAYGQIRNPRYETVVALVAALDGLEESATAEGAT